jgi:hypothetical protein
MNSRVRRVALVQSAYFLATGLAPFVSKRAFEAVTGPKREWWLVETVGAAVTPIGAAIGIAALRREAQTEAAVLGIGTAAGLGIIDVVYHRRGRLRWTYLVDAAAEAALVGAWINALRPRR